MKHKIATKLRTDSGKSAIGEISLAVYLSSYRVTNT